MASKALSTLLSRRTAQRACAVPSLIRASSNILANRAPACYGPSSVSPLTMSSRGFASDASPNPKVAVVLSGCGVFDGSEITEAVATAVQLSRKGYTPVFYAPDRNQMHVLDHTKGEELNQERNVLIESARIARGDIQDLKNLKTSDVAAVIFPGGFGAAKNLSSFATEATNMTVIPEVEQTLKNFHDEKKPIGLCCIAPVLAAKCIPGVTVTVGSDKESEYWPHAGAAGGIEGMGATHVVKDIDGSVLDSENKVVTSPAYMANAKPHEVFDSVANMVNGVISLLQQ
eukprot:gb/GECG01000127.1/.p1 GENE.gb/GECG01000127.1/~~gb/GECG01000127.1/.p1  ORF type:complete len:287 (+),score=34.61 gb/GECG01000127.1/:1-861(+)